LFQLIKRLVYCIWDSSIPNLFDKKGPSPSTNKKVKTNARPYKEVRER